jgi:hypothetical protein
MRAIRTLGAALAGVMTLAGCVTNGSVATTTSSIPPSTTTSVAGSTLPPVVECPGSGEFQEGSGIADITGEDSDGGHLRRISWETSDRCETFTFEFETSEGAPAISVPAMKVDHLDTFQVIRIRMNIDSATVTDQLVETGLVDRLYVVKALDGTMFVDLHLKEPTAARARVESSPARLTLDLKPGFVGFKGLSTVGDEVVVISPARDSDVGLNPLLSGYARTDEDTVLIVVTQDDVVEETSTTSADSSVTWGEFARNVALPPGEVSMFVGRASPGDGTLQGVAFDLNSS